MSDDVLHRVTAVSHRLNRSATIVRQMVDRGDLEAIRLSDGTRLIPERAVQRALALRRDLVDE